MKLNSVSAQVILEALLKKGIKFEVISRRFNLLKIYYREKYLYIKTTSFPVNNQPSCTIANNKFLTKKILQGFNIPVPKSWLVRTSSQAKKLIMAKKMFPCVLKPAEGAHGRQVYANIESIKEFNELLPLVFTESKRRNDVLIEEYIPGKDYRLLVVNDKVSAVMERIPAHVIGDGYRNIRQLVWKYNQNPLIGKKFEKPLCKIIINGEVKRNLKKLGKKFTSIPLIKEKIVLRQNANISTGGVGKDVTDKVCQSVKDLAIQATKAIGMVISGVDIIYNQQSGKAYVLELNDTPGIDIHHYPFIGQARPVADDIVAYLDQELHRKN
jgi:D-alanine-D-alanine ligase-like ATP-grasp enzyme